MPIPDFQTIMHPLLSLAADGAEKKIRSCVDALAKHFDLTEQESQELLPSGHETRFSNRANWAVTYLAKAGALLRTRRSHVRITDRGLQLLREHPDRIDRQTLLQFPEFREFVGAHPPAARPPSDGAIDSSAQESISETPATPEEAIDAAAHEINETLREQLLDKIIELSPAFFERLVVDLIVAMGYGGNRQVVAQHLGRSGDEGIDGVVNEDPLGLDVVYIQAKRYAPENTIGREKIQQFAGALAGKGASKGVFVTTSSFSPGAKEYVRHNRQSRIILIDGDELAKLMIRYGVGVRTERTIELKRIDLDYFDEGDA